MKIAVVRQCYNPYGGAERFVEQALGALVREGSELREGYRQLLCDPPARGRVARDRSFAR